MRAKVTDVDTFRSLNPMNVIGYLRANGWNKFSEVRGRYSVWLNGDYPDAEVVIPFRREATDFTSQLAEAVRELEAAENRSQLDIIRDLLNSGFDVVRLAARSAATNDGTISLPDGVRLIQQARDLLLAAACSAVKPQPVFRARKFHQAVEYISQAKLGQTEHGSFVLTMLSPVAPQLGHHSDTDLFPDDPFPRKVVRMLGTGVGQAISAAEAAATVAYPFSAFEEAVQEGVSANLCEALDGMFEVSQAVQIGMSISWALNRPAPNTVAKRVLVTSDVQPFLKEAARQFRAHDTLEGYTIKGPVVRLAHVEGEQYGKVTILAPVEGTPRKISIDLPIDEYHDAVEAHHAYRDIIVYGDLKLNGKTYQLHKPHGFRIGNSIEDDDEF